MLLPFEPEEKPPALQTLRHLSSPDCQHHFCTILEIAQENKYTQNMSLFQRGTHNIFRIGTTEHFLGLVAISFQRRSAFSLPRVVAGRAPGCWLSEQFLHPRIQERCIPISVFPFHLIKLRQFVPVFDKGFPDRELFRDFFKPPPPFRDKPQKQITAAKVSGVPGRGKTQPFRKSGLLKMNFPQYHPYGSG